MTGKRSRGDVHWTKPGGKRPIGYSTKATSDLIAMLADDGHTVSSAHDAILYDDEAKKILSLYVELGYGGETLTGIGVR